MAPLKEGEVTGTCWTKDLVLVERVIKEPSEEFLQPKVENPTPTPDPEVIKPEDKNTLMRLIEAVVDFIISFFKKSK